MSSEMFVKESRRRRYVWENLESEVNRLISVVKKVDANATLYLFGSVLKKSYNYASDIDILVVTKKTYKEMLGIIARDGFEDPFEIHVCSPKEAEQYFLMLDEIKKLA